MRITFSSSFRDNTYGYYLKQPKSKSEIRFNQILAKNPGLIYCLKRYSNYTFISKYTNREIIFLNERNWEPLSIKVNIQIKLFEE